RRPGPCSSWPRRASVRSSTVPAARGSDRTSPAPDPVSSPTRRTLLAMHRNLIELILFSTHAELRAERSRSYLGLIWWIAEPAMMMAAFWLVFDVILNTGGPDYLPFLLVGLTFWQWMKSCITHGGYA